MKKLSVFFILLILLSCSKTKIESDPQNNDVIISDSIDHFDLELNNYDSLQVDAIDILIDSLLEKKLRDEKEEQVNNIENKKSIEVKDTKAIYLSGYTIASRKYKQTLKKAKEAGLNTIVFDVKNMNGTIFASSAQKQLLMEHDYESTFNIAKRVKAIHGLDMKAVARVVMFHDRYSAQRDSLLCPRRLNGKRWVEKPNSGPSWLDSSDITVQNDLLQIIELVALSGVDEIQLDYIRFPTQGDQDDLIFDFQKEDLLKKNIDSTYVFRKRSDVIENFVSKISVVCKKYNVDLAADVFAIIAWQREDDVEKTGQDLNKMTKYLDYIHPMIYSSHFNKNFGHREDVYNEPYQILFMGTLLTIENSNKNCLVAPYIQANNWRVNYDKEYVFAQIAAIKDAGGEGFVLWNAQNNYEKVLRWLTEKGVDY